jgi:hypothetical protein
VATAKLESCFSKAKWMYAERRRRMSSELLAARTILVCNQEACREHVHAAVAGYVAGRVVVDERHRANDSDSDAFGAVSGSGSDDGEEEG